APPAVQNQPGPGDPQPPGCRWRAPESLFLTPIKAIRKNRERILITLYIVSILILNTIYRGTQNDAPHASSPGRDTGQPPRPARARDPLHRRIPAPPGLARQRQRQPGLFAGRPDPEHVGQDDRRLLAQPRLPRGHRPGTSPGRPAHP